MGSEYLITEDNILLDWNPNSKEEAIDRLSSLLVDLGVVIDKEGFLKDIYEREARGFTFAGDYLAIPHGWSKYVTSTSIAILKTEDAFVWDEGGNLVKLVIMFVIPESYEIEEDLKIIGRLFSSLGDEELVRKLLDTSRKEELVKLISNYAGFQ